jgi:ATPase family associated with various cellular activities (AAA)
MEPLPKALDRVYEAIAAVTGAGADDAPGPSAAAVPGSPAAATEPWTALDRLSDLFGLTAFERDVLVMLVGHTLEDRFARAGTPTFGLALAALDEPHWSALSAARPLRYWQLVTADPGTLVHGTLRLDEPVLAYLIGMPSLDERLHPFTRPLPHPGDDAWSGDDGQAVLAAARHWASPATASQLLLLAGPARAACERAFAAICASAGLLPYVLDAADVPAGPADRQQLARLWTREAALNDAALYVRTDSSDLIPNVSSLLSCLDCPVAVEALPGGPAQRLPGLRLELTSLTSEERREHARHGLQGRATQVEPAASWDDLVLPDAQVRTLRQVALHVRHRELVNGRWGFAGKHPRGLGLTALFAGTSGTGKTMAAEVIAGELGLDLYRIDLATVVSKYIGETEKNLQAVFAAATHSGAILLFDEADALFGRRSEVRDSHDRYANLEVSYLLQQMETYQGVAILTTNMQHALDAAFLRRLRFVVQFPFPDAPARERIWRGVFPAATPVGELDFAALARLNVSGGVIRNIAVLAAFLAAGDSGRVEARHILSAARTEYAKLDKPLTAAETRGWQ